MKKYIPKSVKIQLHLSKRWLKYRLMQPLKFATIKKDYLDPQVEIELEIKKSGNYPHKYNNISLAAQKIDKIYVQPGEVISFWKCVGIPGKKQGFLESRTIIGNTTREEYGGGICQVSGLMYYLALQSGLEIVERANHSRDIYTEESRFTPLGTDATVVYGYKDLLIRNNKPFPIQLGFEVEDGKIVGTVRSEDSIQPVPLSIHIEENEKAKNVTITNAEKEAVGVSVYVK